MTYILGEENKPSLEEFLAHHGVKGMKWGVRKEDTSGGSARATAKKDMTPEQLAVHIHRRELGKNWISSGLSIAAAVGTTAVTGDRLAGTAAGSATRVATLAVMARVNRRKQVGRALVVGGLVTGVPGARAGVKWWAQQPYTVVQSNGVPHQVYPPHDGGLFNPKAKLDTSRMGDANTPTSSWDTGGADNFASALSEFNHG